MHVLFFYLAFVCIHMVQTLMKKKLINQGAYLAKKCIANLQYLWCWGLP